MMRPTYWWIAFLLLITLGAGTSRAADNVGSDSSAEHMWVDLYQVDSSHWEAAVSLENRDLLAAMTLPFRWGNGNSRYLIDSATYVDSRLEYFALKTYLVDTAQQTVLIGLVSDLGMGLPPLEPGSGLIALLHFTRVKQTTRPLTLDSAFIPPHNTLQLVTPDVRAITPKLDIRHVDHAAEAPRE